MNMRGWGQAPTYDVERTSRVKLKKPVEIAEKDGHRQQQRVNGVSKVMSDEFDPLADEDQGHYGRKNLDVLWAKVEKASIPENGPMRKCGQVHGICTPRLLSGGVSTTDSSTQAQTHTSRYPSRRTCW